MTDATAKQQGESKRRREHPEVPQAADSSSSSESSTDTEMGLVDVSTTICGNSEVLERSGKPVAVAEGREGGFVTHHHWHLKFDRCDERRCAEQFGYTDNCPGCANARAGRKQAVDHSEQCRSRMETIASTTTEGHERLERARDRFCSGCQGTGGRTPELNA